MWKREIEVEADSLEAARKQVKSQLPKGFHLISEEVVSDGTLKTHKVYANTIKTAFQKALGDVPPDAEIIEKKVLSAPVEKTVTVEAFDEQSALAQAHLTYHTTWGIKGVTLRTPGKKGILGFGKKPNYYDVKVIKYAVVKVTYKGRAKIRVAVAQTDQILKEQIPIIIHDVIAEIEKGWGDWGIIEEGLAFLNTLKSIGPNVLPVLVEALKEEGNKWPRASVLCWASGMYKEEALPILIELISTDDRAVRSMAKDILCCLGSQKTEKAINDYEKASAKRDEARCKLEVSAIVQSIRENSVENLDKKGLIAKLLWLSSQTEYLGSGGLGFALVRDIGQRLYDLGGSKAMDMAYRRLGRKEWNEERKGKLIPGGIASLNLAWAGIGGWLP